MKDTLMNTALKLDPLIYEFDTADDAASYDAWFRAKVEKSMNDAAPNLSHDEALAFVEAELKRRKATRGAR